MREKGNRKVFVRHYEFYGTAKMNETGEKVVEKQKIFEQLPKDEK